MSISCCSRIFMNWSIYPKTISSLSFVISKSKNKESPCLLIVVFLGETIMGIILSALLRIKFWRALVFPHPLGPITNIATLFEVRNISISLSN